MNLKQYIVHYLPHNIKPHVSVILSPQRTLYISCKWNCTKTQPFKIFTFKFRLSYFLTPLTKIQYEEHRREQSALRE